MFDRTCLSDPDVGGCSWAEVLGGSKDGAIARCLGMIAFITGVVFDFYIALIIMLWHDILFPAFMICVNLFGFGLTTIGGHRIVANCIWSIIHLFEMLLSHWLNQSCDRQYEALLVSKK